MKKIIVVLALLFAFGSFKQATAQARVSYYYYPSSNVYYNISTGDYWYYNPGSTAWITVRSLPSGITITRTPRYIVYYNGKDVWKDNASHKTKYKNKIKKTQPKKSTPVKAGNKN